jgi:FtsZ-binding cell division protein ZapB
MKINIIEDDRYPYYYASDSDLEPTEVATELTAEEFADYQRVSAEHRAWQERLREIYCR